MRIIMWCEVVHRIMLSVQVSVFGFSQGGPDRDSVVKTKHDPDIIRGFVRNENLQ